MQYQKRVKNVSDVQKTVTCQLQVSHDCGFPLFSDFLQELQRLYDVEKNIKNNLYSFILEHRMSSELKQYERTHKMSASGGHERAVSILANAPVDFIEISRYDIMREYIGTQEEIMKRLMKVILKSIQTKEPIRDGDKELGKIIDEYEKLIAEPQQQKSLMEMTDDEINRFNEKKKKVSEK